MRAPAVETYADGFGLWHAVVPTVGTVKAQQARARRAITRELRERSGPVAPVVRLAPVPPTDRDGTRNWSELPAA